MERYSRQLLVLGLELQQKLKELKVTVVGCGALGSTLVELLTRIGVGYIKVIDADIVEISNLHRTLLFTEKDVGKPKALVCKERAKEINNEVEIEAITDIIDETNVEELVKDSHYVFDALDNLYFRLLLNDACVKHSIPLIYGGVMGEYSSVKLVLPYKNACLSCFLNYEGEEENVCETIGTLDTIVTTTASLQVQLMLNHLRGEEDNNLYYFDFRNMRFDKIKIERNEKCQACSLHEFRFLNSKEKKPACGIVKVEKEGPNNGFHIEKNKDGIIICYGDKCFKKVSR
ncbi:HesA/MoeB/ThiF family protein [Sulfurisphaera tokodaii]|uniref:Adenylyltransferase n=2 Tax=Sulfurisphaera tokodaii TaxID=111955 RepID=Q96YA1_SULTO|nr:HesA/MoeB/ThiF family protein [Sulfurisphaera tokodaii]BAB67376.1 adenylyltransferase [Sulfurisphaera tokodaii str. 7]HII75088.1 HesA/MoeB/ThiF family protein [Sulfurisphaera tokodaii]